jgi:hypothetical protein
MCHSCWHVQLKVTVLSDSRNFVFYGPTTRKCKFGYYVCMHVYMYVRMYVCIYVRIYVVVCALSFLY